MPVSVPPAASSTRLAECVAWIGAGTDLLVERLAARPAADLPAPSLLPGWSRAHVLAHLARGADALDNLVTWARTGIETPMYPNRGDRLAHIERCAARPASVLLADFRCSAGLLLAAITALPGSAWRAPVRTALGRTIPAGEIPWLRVREMWTHLVDLDVGVGFADLPAELVDALLSDAAALLAPRPRCPALLLRPTDRAEPIVLRGASASAGGGGGGGGGPAVTGPASALLGWLTGRATTGVHADPPGPLPPLPRWL